MESVDLILKEDETMKAKAFMVYQYWLRECEALKVEWVKSVSLKIRTQKVIYFKGDIIEDKADKKIPEKG